MHTPTHTYLRGRRVGEGGEGGSKRGRDRDAILQKSLAPVFFFSFLF